MRFRSTNTFFVFSLQLSLACSSAFAFMQTEENSTATPANSPKGTLPFSPRDDERAPQDLKELRWILSQLQKENGERNPLADYVEKPSSLEERAKRSRWQEDDEAHAIPKLFKNPTAEYASPDIQPTLPEIRPTESNQSSASMVGASQRARVEPIYDPCYVPILKRPAIPTKLVSANSDRTALQPEIPFNSQPSTPPAMGGGGLPSMGNPPMGFNNPGLPNQGFASPVLPNNISPSPTDIGGAATTVPSYNPAGMGAPTYASPPAVFPNPATGNLGVLPSNPTLITPSPSGYSDIPLPGPGTPSGGGMVMPAPPATYAPSTGLGSGNSPSNAYAPGTGIVNSQPFVNAPPCQKDARYMVSPTVYRQNVGCNSCGSNTYAPTTASGSPFSYTPPTYFPGAFNGYASQYRPLIGLGQDVRQAQLGRGIIGQPVAYMPSQPLRNVLRYLFP